MIDARIFSIDFFYYPLLELIVCVLLARPFIRRKQYRFGFLAGISLLLLHPSWLAFNKYTFGRLFPYVLILILYCAIFYGIILFYQKISFSTPPVLPESPHPKKSSGFWEFYFPVFLAITMVQSAFGLHYLAENSVFIYTKRIGYVLGMSAISAASGLLLWALLIPIPEHVVIPPAGILAYWKAWFTFIAQITIGYVIFSVVFGFCWNLLGFIFFG